MLAHCTLLHKVRTPKKHRKRPRHTTQKAYRVKSLEKQILKTKREHEDLMEHPRTFSYIVAFGNPGGCMSKSLRKRVERYHNKLSDLHKKEQRLQIHKKIVEGKPLTIEDKRNYLYASNWGGSYSYKSEELDTKFNRALKDAPAYVQKGYYRR